MQVEKVKNIPRASERPEKGRFFVHISQIRRGASCDYLEADDTYKLRPMMYNGIADEDDDLFAYGPERYG